MESYRWKGLSPGQISARAFNADSPGFRRMEAMASASLFLVRGGPVGVAMQRALDLSTEATLKAAWMVRNCSYSEFLFSAGRFTLSSYNATPHFTDPEFLTHR